MGEAYTTECGHATECATMDGHLRRCLADALARCAALEAQVTLLSRCAALESQVRKDHARVQSKSKPDIVYCMACQAWEWPCIVLTTLGLAATENGGTDANRG